MFPRKRKLLCIYWLCLLMLPALAQEVRQPAVAGSFYPEQPSALRAALESCFREAAEDASARPVRALVVPHAGYVFSGTVAAAAYSRIPQGSEYKNVFLIGTSHTALYPGASVYASGSFSTPLGEVPVNEELARELAGSCREFNTRTEVHGPEHSLEVQLPFLQYRLKPGFRIIPVLIGTRDPARLRNMALSLRKYFTPDNLFVISTDFSHYPPAEEATRIDRSTAEAVLQNDPDHFLGVFRRNDASDTRGLATAMCGWPGVYCLLSLTEEENGLEYRLLRYSHSGNGPGGDMSRTVGYWAIELVTGIMKPSATTMILTDDEKRQLLEIARKTLENYLGEKSIPAIDSGKILPGLSRQGGAFVTLSREGELRGCIGRFSDSNPLYLVVQKMAVSAATQDSRFRPVNREELDELEIEISVLSPLVPIQSKDEIVPGKHGIYMRRGFSTGTFLPQLWSRYGWTVEEFLGHCARDKAGIGYYGWKNAELFVYEALVFGEKEMKNP